MSFVPSVPLTTIVGTTNITKEIVTTLTANTMTLGNGLTVNSGPIYANASSVTANTLTLGNGLTVTSGAVYANASSLTANILSVLNGASVGNNMVVGSYTTPSSTLTIQGSGGGGATCQILGQTYNVYPNAPPAAIIFVDNGAYSATINLSTKTSGSATNPLLTRFSLTDTTATFSTNVSHSAGTLAAPSITFTGDTGTGIYKPSTGNVGIVSQGVAAMYATASGISVPGNLTASNVVVQGNLTFTTSNASIWTSATQTTYGALQLSTPSNANALTISQNGFVGIGTAYPVSNLHVVGNVTISGTLTYNSIINSITANTVSANTMTANSMTVTGNTTCSSIAVSGTILPSLNTSFIQWLGGNPTNMIEVYGSSASDRYGLGQLGGGTLRLYTSANTSASLCLGRYSNVGTPVSTDWIVCNAGGIYHQTQMTMTANSIVFVGGANTQPIADRSGTFASYVNAATLNFPAFSGMVLVNNANVGAVTLFLLGGNSATIVANSNTNPQTGTFAVNTGISGYTWTNTSGNTISASFTAIRTNSTS